MIKNNQGRKGQELWTQAQDGDKLTLYIAENDDEEAQYVCARILGGKAQGMGWGDFAVLYRMNAQSNRLEYAMKRNSIPYKVVGGTRFFDRAEIKDMTSYLCALHTPEDDLRLLRIINSPPRGIGNTTIERLRNIAAENRLPVNTVIENCDLYPELKNSVSKLRAFAELMASLREAANTMPLDQFYDLLIEKTGYVTALGTSDEALARVDNIWELKSNIVNYMERTPEPTLAGFLDEIALYTDLDGLDDNGDSVIMMTIHAAKGLEFPWVFLVGMEDGIFPSLRSIGEIEDMEEERRLCYVAITRAKRRLTITAARRRMLFGHTSSNLISRFVDEIPDEHIDKPADTRPAYDGGYERVPDQDYMEYRHREMQGYSAGGYGAGVEARRSSYGQRPTSPAKRPDPARTPPAKTKLLEISVGDRVRHKAFGEGVVSAYTAMPGDALITVDFASGQKRLMLKTAGAFMEKI